MPVAEQGASSRIASTWAGGDHFMTSAATILACEPGARQILGKSRQTTLRDVDRGHLPAGGGELHGLAARRGAQVEHGAPLARARAASAGKAAEMSCTHHLPSP